MQLNKQLFYRLFIYILGLFLLAIGSNISISTKLGVSPINSLPYTISVISNVKLGILVPVVHSFIVLIQAIVLKREFKSYYLLEVGFVVIFGMFISLTSFITLYIVPTHLIAKIILMFISLFFIALGVSFYVNANLLNMPIEAISLALNKKYPKIPFHSFKMYIDCTFVILSIILGLMLTGEIIGIGIGTILSALLVGKIIPYTNKIAMPIINKLIN